eukprot:Trichotokara_eunicae@DN4822_c0_g1_i2.p2
MEKRSEASFGDLDFKDIGGKTLWTKLFDCLEVPGRRHPGVSGKCEICGNESHSFCTRCSCAYYCGVEHQTEHWPLHKQECNNNKNKSIPASRLMLPAVSSYELIVPDV